MRRHRHLLTSPQCAPALLAAALQITVATFARSFKEAQTYMSVMIFLPMLPGLLFTIQPIKTAGWMMLVPVLGQQGLVELLDVAGDDVEARVLEGQRAVVSTQDPAQATGDLRAIDTPGHTPGHTSNQEAPPSVLFRMPQSRVVV